MSRMLTLKQVAEKLSLHLNTVRKYINQGMLPVMQIERTVRVDERCLERFIEEHKKTRGKTKRVSSPFAMKGEMKGEVEA